MGIQWTDSPDKSLLQAVLKTCKCRTHSCLKCSCRKAGLTCLASCYCKKKCDDERVGGELLKNGKRTAKRGIGTNNNPACSVTVSKRGRSK